MTTYHFTHNGETRELNPGEIKRWTGIPMTREALQTNLEWIAENIGNPKYKLLAFTVHGVMTASSYRMAAGRARSKAAAQRSEFTRNAVAKKPTGGVRLKTGERA